MDEQTEGAKTAKPWLSNNLVALGSVAVFSVYSAGYFRTRDAAARFAGESVQRHAAALAAPRSSGDPRIEVVEQSQQEKTELPVMRLSSKSKTPPSESHAATPSNAPVVDSATTAPMPSPPIAARPAAVAPTPAPTPAPAPAPSPTAAPVADSSVLSVAKKNESGQLKDGVYYGWGTSRHGDIQASVEIKSGKIIGAYISQCLTQYSCSWVSALPPEVVDRQSAEVDYVSGATQSSNAFYYAVMDALKKAK
jgi:uncharacterized protein with FMN-binding domain